jgi:hypothetical protein
VTAPAASPPKPPAIGRGAHAIPIPTHTGPAAIRACWRPSMHKGRPACPHREIIEQRVRPCPRARQSNRWIWASDLSKAPALGCILDARARPA